MIDSSPNPLSEKVKLVISDIDGTLVNNARELTPRARKAVFALRDAGIRFTVISARPPSGVAPLMAVLQIAEPVACFNGALFVSPEHKPVAEKTMRPEDVLRVGHTIQSYGLDVWLYSPQGWFVSNLHGSHVEHQTWLVQLQPQAIKDLETLTAGVWKMVGVSDNFDAVVRCETQLQQDLSLQVSATRSQSYYLDVSHRDANKGAAVEQIARLTRVPTEQIATIGDMPTDVFMFRVSGVSIAMGNASADVQSAATYVTASNEEDGFALAMERYFLAQSSTSATTRT